MHKVRDKDGLTLMYDEEYREYYTVQRVVGERERGIGRLNVILGCVFAPCYIPSMKECTEYKSN